MTPLAPLIQNCRGKRYVGLTEPSCRVEIYVGASAIGALRPRTELVISGETEFAWGSACHRAHLLAVSILDDALAFEPYRAVALAPYLRDGLIRGYAPTASWVLPYNRLFSWIAIQEDGIAEERSR